jgi:hypothetical protein
MISVAHLSINSIAVEKDLLLISTLQRILEVQEEMLALLKNGSNSENTTQLLKANSELMTRQQAKDYLGIGETTYKRKVKDGVLKPIKMPGGDRFYKSDLLDAFKESVRRGRVCPFLE